jgi:hypothetical protein
VTALAEFACSLSGVIASNEPCGNIIASNATAAVQAGCNDPMVNYLYIKYAMSQTNSKEAFTAAFLKTARTMETSPYPDIRKFYAGFRAIEQYNWANHYTNWNPNMAALSFRTSDHLCAVISDSNTPAAVVHDSCHDYLHEWEGTTNDYPKIWASMEPPIFRNWPNDANIWLLKGEACVRMAWISRGNGYANTVTGEGWKGFNDNLATAEDALNRAWKINPQDIRIPMQMMSVMLGQGGGRERMETWFNHAIQLDPNSYDICSYKLYYLEPKWHGSIEAMLSFGRECATNSQWGGHIPLILLDAHVTIQKNYVTDPEAQTNYWKQPQVWLDLKTAFDRFFELNPAETGWHHDYGRYAYWCGQWDEFLHQTALFGSSTNYDFFGGKNAFDQMTEIARKNASK